MSTNSLTPHTDAKSIVRLEDATQFDSWSKWAINLFVHARILEDVDTAQPHYPIGGKATLVADTEWWHRLAKQQAIKVLKDDGVCRPILRIEIKYDKDDTVLTKAIFDKKEATAMKANKEAIETFNFQFQTEFTKTLNYLKGETKRTIFEAIQASLGLHYQSALQVTTYGDAMGLFLQVEKFNPSDKESRRGLLINQFWEATFQKEGANDLAVWINYITTTVNDLEQLGEKISEASRTSRLQH